MGALIRASAISAGKRKEDCRMPACWTLNVRRIVSCDRPVRDANVARAFRKSPRACGDQPQRAAVARPGIVQRQPRGRPLLGSEPGVDLRQFDLLAAVEVSWPRRSWPGRPARRYRPADARCRTLPALAGSAARPLASGPVCHAPPRARRPAGRRPDKSSTAGVFRRSVNAHWNSPGAVTCSSFNSGGRNISMRNIGRSSTCRITRLSRVRSYWPNFTSDCTSAVLLAASGAAASRSRNGTVAKRYA